MLEVSHDLEAPTAEGLSSVGSRSFLVEVLILVIVALPETNVLQARRGLVPTDHVINKSVATPSVKRLMRILDIRNRL